MFNEGDIVEIPLPDGRIAIGMILHLSERFKNGVCFIVFGIKGQAAEKVTWNDDTGQPKSMKVLGPLFTNIKASMHYGWKTIAHKPLTERDRLLTKCIVGGGVYIGDEFLGTVDEVGDANLPKMLAMGMPVVYDEIEKEFGKKEST